MNIKIEMQPGISAQPMKCIFNKQLNFWPMMSELSRLFWVEVLFLSSIDLFNRFSVNFRFVINWSERYSFRAYTDTSRRHKINAIAFAAIVPPTPLLPAYYSTQLRVTLLREAFLVSMPSCIRFINYFKFIYMSTNSFAIFSPCLVVVVECEVCVRNVFFSLLYICLWFFSTPI